MSQWTLGGVALHGARVTLGVANADDALCEWDDSYAGDLPSAGEWLPLAVDGTVVLYGRVTALPRGTAGASGRRAVRLIGPWGEMERLTYQQTFKVAVETGTPGVYTLQDKLRPVVTLGQDDEGERLSTLQQVQAIVTYASAAGIPVSMGGGFTGQRIEAEEVNGQSCAACLLAMMRWHPDVFPFFEYSSGGATLHFTPAGSLAVTTVAHGATTAVDLTPLPDYAPQGLRIIYERDGGNGIVQAKEDTAGSVGTGGAEPGVINWLIRLDGTVPTPSQTQDIRTRVLPRYVDEGSEADIKAWWKAHVPWMRATGVDMDDLLITVHTVKVDTPLVTEDDDEVIESTWDMDEDGYPNELLDGTVQPWMGRRAAPMTVDAKVRWIGAGPPPAAVKQAMGDDASAVLDLHACVTGTNAVTRRYHSLGESASLPEWPDAGLAASFMAAFTSAAWEGGVTVKGQEQPILSPGRRLNVSGGHSGWASMNAPVWRVTYDAASHSTSAEVGPPKNLGVADFAELQRVSRLKNIVSWMASFERRTAGTPTGGGNTSGGFNTPRDNVTQEGGGGAADTRSFRIKVKQTVTDKWLVGVTYGIFQLTEGDSVVPEIEGEPLEPGEVTWFSDELEVTDSRGIWAKVTKDDTDPFLGNIGSVDLELLDEEPSSSLGIVWRHIGSVGPDGAETKLVPASLTQGSQGGHRLGGPGSSYAFYPL